MPKSGCTLELMAKRRDTAANLRLKQEYEERQRQQRRSDALRRASKQSRSGPITVTYKEGFVPPTQPKIKYAEYITSRDWELRKKRYFATNYKGCWACGRTKDIHLHHHTYERLGAELDEDLVPLCEVCHTNVHRRHKGKKGAETLTESTLLYIEERRKMSRV